MERIVKTIAQAIKDKRALPDGEETTIKILLNGTDRTSQLIRDGIGRVDYSFEKSLSVVKPADAHVVFDDVATVKTPLLLDWTDKMEIQLGYGADLVSYFKGYISPEMTDEDDLGIELGATSIAKKLERSPVSTYLGIERMTSLRRILEKLITNLNAAPPPNGVTFTLNLQNTEYDVELSKRLSWIEFIDAAGPNDAGSNEGSGVAYRYSEINAIGNLNRYGFASTAFVSGSGSYDYYWIVHFGDKVRCYGIIMRTKEIEAKSIWTVSAQASTDRMKILYASGGASGESVFCSGRTWDRGSLDEQGNNFHQLKHIWRVNVDDGTIIEQADLALGADVTMESGGYFPASDSINRAVFSGWKTDLGLPGLRIRVQFINPATGAVTNTFLAPLDDGGDGTGYVPNPRCGATGKFSTLYHHFFRTDLRSYRIRSDASVDADLKRVTLPGTPILTGNGSVFAGTQRIYYVASGQHVVDHTETIHTPSLPSSVPGLAGPQHGQGDQTYIVQQIQSGVDAGKVQFVKILANDVTPFTPTVTVFSKEPFPDEFKKIVPAVGFYATQLFGSPVRIESNGNLLIPHSCDSTAGPTPTPNLKGSAAIHFGDVVIPHLIVNDFTQDNADSVRDVLEDIVLASSAFWMPSPVFGEIKIVRRKLTGAAAAAFLEKDYELDSFSVERFDAVDYVDINGSVFGSSKVGGRGFSVMIHWLPSQIASDLGKFYYDLYSLPRELTKFRGNFLIEIDPGDIISVTVGAITKTGFVYRLKQTQFSTDVEMVKVY